MGASSSIVFLNRSSANIPVGRVNDRNPLGHSGQRKLHEVVGSNATAMGMPV